MDILTLAQARIDGLKKKTANEWAGPCPECGGTDRFLVWTHRELWHCRICDETGDAIAFLRKFEGKSCPEAHAELGLDCSSTSCPVIDTCSKGNGLGKSKPQKQSLQVPAEKKQPEFTPAPAQTPHQIWMQQAAELVAKAHAALLACPEQLDYLDARGLPLEAVQKGQLGWLPENRYPARETWGLPTEYKEGGKKKKMFIPAGILIPFFDAERKPHRIRIRRSEIREQDARYFWIKGSGDDVPVIGGADRRGLVVVESDLDAFMVRWQCRDLDIAVIPLGTCSAKPKGWAMQALQQALAILVAHDFEPRHNEKTGKPENPGGQGARWWLQQFPRAKRWPIPIGKDPGEYYQDHGGDIRQWILTGLPPVFHLPAPACVPAPKLAAAPQSPPYHKGTSGSGRTYYIANNRETYNQLLQQHPDTAILSPREIRLLKGMTQDEAELHLAAKATFQGVFKDVVDISVKEEAEAVQGELLL